MLKIAGSGSGSGSVSICQRYGSQDPDPYQNFMDPQHWPDGYYNKWERYNKTRYHRPYSQADGTAGWLRRNSRQGTVIPLGDIYD
jgi:hypothetical protein